jgi:putative transposase
MTKHSPFRDFKTSPEIIRLAVMMYVRFPLSLRNVEDLLHERGIDMSHETIRFWWNRFGPMSELPHRHQPPSRINKVIRRTVLRRLSGPLKAIERPPPHALGF